MLRLVLAQPHRAVSLLPFAASVCRPTPRASALAVPRRSFGGQASVDRAFIQGLQQQQPQQQKTNSAAPAVPFGPQLPPEEQASPLTDRKTAAAAAAAVAKRTGPIVYRPFIPTNDWQEVGEDHILPPGLWIRFDMDNGTKQARLQPQKAATAAPQPQEPQQQPPQEPEAKREEPTVNQAAATPASSQSVAAEAGSSSPAPASAASAEPVAASASPPSPSATRVALGINAATAAVGKKKKLKPHMFDPNALPATTKSGGQSPRSGSRRSMSTSTKPAKPVNSSRNRPSVLPCFPQPTPEFLAARALLPGPGVPTVAVAPMVDVSDRHFRFLLRLISKRVVLYTPMIVDNALCRAPHANALFTQHQAMEHPLVAQLGGSEAAGLVAAARRCEAQGFQAINLNVGCPAPSAIGHKYGACLMSEPSFPSVVRQVVDAVSIPVTIKCRIGLNANDSYEFFKSFVTACHEIGGVTHFIVHARKAILNLKSAGKNLTIPKLNYDFVRQIKAEMPHLRIEINGGVDSVEQAKEHIDSGLDGVMIGRLAWKHPYALSTVDKLIYGDDTPPLSRIEIARRYIEYIEQEWAQNQKELAEYAEWTEKENAAAEAKAAAEPAAASGDAPDGESEATRAPLKESPFPIPHPLDARTLIKPLGYLWTHEPGYRHFRLLLEEGLLRHQEWSMREILERAIAAVEPPPARQWGDKDEGFEYSPAAKEEMKQAQAALAAGGAAAQARHKQQQQLQVHAEQLARAHAEQSQPPPQIKAAAASQQAQGQS